jgi:hypothetical protein
MPSWSIDGARKMGVRSTNEGDDVVRRSGAGVILVALLAAGCLAGPVPPENVVVEVFNQTSVTGMLQWQGPSGSGDQSIEPCRIADTSEGLGPGTWQVTISGGSATLTANVTAPATGIAYEVFGIAPDGRIAHLYSLTDQQSLPPRPSGC